MSLSPDHNTGEDDFVPQNCNLWRLTGDIHAEWSRLIAPFNLEDRLQLTSPGHYGDLDMLQIGPLGKPNRAEVVFKPSPLTPNEQYFQVTLWCILTQPLLLSCNIPTMDAFDLNLVTNDEVLAVNQDALCSQGYRVANESGEWEIWAKDLADEGKAVALFNLSGADLSLSVTVAQLGIEASRLLAVEVDVEELARIEGLSDVVREVESGDGVVRELRVHAHILWLIQGRGEAEGMARGGEVDVATWFIRLRLQGELVVVALVLLVSIQEIERLAEPLQGFFGVFGAIDFGTFIPVDSRVCLKVDTI